MRCDDVIRELAVPSDGRDDRALAEHLAQCETCSRRAERAAAIDRLWNATRPIDPAPDVWDRLWSSVHAQLDRGVPAVSRFERGSELPSSSSRRWRGLGLVAAIGLAQAAGILLALNLSWTNPVPRTPQVIFAGPHMAAEAVVDIPEGQVAYIRSDGSDIHVLDVTAADAGNGEDPWFVFFNRVESASTMVAMSE